MSEQAPLVSCLMLSVDRLQMAAQAMHDYHAQTYPRLELVIVSQGTAAYVAALTRHVTERGYERVRIVTADPAMPMGPLRNVALEAARGELVCQWDDDDRYHPDRVLRQFEQLRRDGAQACYLTDNLHLMQARRQVFWTDWTLREQRVPEYRVFPPTVMMAAGAARWPDEGPGALRGEDQAIAERLYASVPVTTLASMAWLYLYVFHGANQMTPRHHEELTLVRSAPADRIRPHTAEIRSALRYFGVQGPIDVRGIDRPAFQVA